MSQNKQYPVGLSLVAGASAGMAESFITYPTEFVKTMSQLGVRGTNKIAVSPLAVIKATFSSRGITGFYSGCGPVIAGNAVKAGTRFFCYESIRDLLRSPDGKLSTTSNLLAGIGAGCVESVVAVTPSEAIKTRLIESQRAGVTNPGGSLAVIGTMIRTESIASFYRGLLPTMMKQSANSAVRFTSYQAMKDYVTDRNGGTAPGNTTIMAIGAAAGVITVCKWSLSVVVKTRMQQSTVHYSSTLGCLISSLKQDGLLVFWRGASPRVARLVVSGTVTFVIYENVLSALQRLT
ncbi:tricarboxylate transporter [Kwoniella heveanensis BCC8398]|uniref:Tricarboxylate transporter n=1 Tax=Kwoniella heveanensis BCC8398 TaxID=1296120 RepID=A0A1B9GIZ9_9TREE|nr:tricarboxylate transporter [Kwoniella heveanensis BCC8398]